MKPACQSTVNSVSDQRKSDILDYRTQERPVPASSPGPVTTKKLSYQPQGLTSASKLPLSVATLSVTF